jgi:alanine-glyoxylate transaminase/serine-glyoxylate transaminase/serine-pyruvate transaminase
MIPGAVEVSPAVLARFGEPPPGHLAPRLIGAFGAALEMMRQVWLAEPSSQPFIVAGGGTTAMDMAAANLLEPGQRALLVNTGYFSARFAEMLRRQGAEVLEVSAAPGHAPEPHAARTLLDGAAGPVQVLFATHVDTSTGVRLDPRPWAALACERGMLSVFDGVCATGAERFDMAGWHADVYLTASQKAIGLPPGLGLLVVSERALAARAARRAAPPAMVLDWEAWLPVMRAYEARRPAYFSTPATNLVLALEVGLQEILEHGMERRFALHERAGRAVRAAWRALGLDLVPERPEWAANTLSAIRLPARVDPTLVARILDHGVIVAGGLHPELANRYFRVGHMGYAATRDDMLLRTVAAVAAALCDCGLPVGEEAVAAAREVLAD